MRVFDAHQHLIYPEIFNYPWIDSAPALQRGFTLEQYQAITSDFPIEASLFVEVDTHEDESAREAAHFCELADDSANRVTGVIAAARPEHPHFEAYLDRISHQALKGIRRVLYAQPAGLSCSRSLRRTLSCWRSARSLSTSASPSRSIRPAMS